MIEQEEVNEICNAVDDLRDELIKLIVDTVQIPSVNPTYPDIDIEQVGGGESRVNEFVQPVMEAIGLETDLWEEEKGRANLVGTFHGEEETGTRSLIFNGHVDVVPAGPEELWTAAGPWSGKVLDRKIYGRGTSDMKAGNAAALMAIKALLQAGFRPKNNVIIESVVGEEMMNTEAGTGATIKRGYKADAAIVVEPTAPPYPLGLSIASPGVLVMKITVAGKASHTCARDELIRAGGRGSKVAVSAIDKGFILYQGLLKLEDEWGQTKTHPAFTRPGHFTLCPAKFMGGFNGIGYIPEKCIMEYVVWHAPQEKPEEVQAEVEIQISRFADTDPWLREHPPEVEWTFCWPPYEVSSEEPICKAVQTAYQAALNKSVQTNGFAAVNDATFLNQAGIPTISLGPGSIQLAHTANEYVEIEDVVDATKVYALIIAEWCGV